jgi:hypothetical protein
VCGASAPLETILIAVRDTIVAKDWCLFTQGTPRRQCHTPDTETLGVFVCGTKRVCAGIRADEPPSRKHIRRVLCVPDGKCFGAGPWSHSLHRSPLSHTASNTIIP